MFAALRAPGQYVLPLFTILTRYALTFEVLCVSSRALRSHVYPCAARTRARNYTACALLPLAVFQLVL